MATEQQVLDSYNASVQSAQPLVQEAFQKWKAANPSTPNWQYTPKEAKQYLPDWVIKLGKWSSAPSGGSRLSISGEDAGRVYSNQELGWQALNQSMQGYQPRTYDPMMASIFGQNSPLSTGFTVVDGVAMSGGGLGVTPEQVREIQQQYGPGGMQFTRSGWVSPEQSRAMQSGATAGQLGGVSSIPSSTQASSGGGGSAGSNMTRTPSFMGTSSSSKGGYSGGGSYAYDPAYGGIPRLPSYAEDITTQSQTGTTTTVGPDIQAQLIKNLPGYQNMLAADVANIQSNLAGQVAPDVISLLQQQAAERGVGTGMVGSENVDAAYLRALGLTSLQLKQLGNTQLTGAMARTPIQQMQTVAQNLVTSGTTRRDLRPEQAIYAAAPVPAAAAAAALRNAQAGMGYGNSLVSPSRGAMGGYGGGGVSSYSFPRGWGTTPTTTPMTDWGRAGDKTAFSQADTMMYGGKPRYASTSGPAVGYGGTVYYDADADINAWLAEYGEPPLARGSTYMGGVPTDVGPSPMITSLPAIPDYEPGPY